VARWEPVSAYTHCLVLWNAHTLFRSERCEWTLLLILFGVQNTGKNCLKAARLVSPPCVNTGALRHVSIKLTTNREVNLMASQKHLDLLLSGKILWNTWRRAYPDVQAVEPDLHVAGLHDADLSGIDLSQADLRGAILDKAIFAGASLPRGNLRRTDPVNRQEARERGTGSDVVPDDHAA
jgi:hypothetical protein